MPVIRFKTKLSKIGSWTILRLPKTASLQLPSRGQTMITGTLNGIQFRTPLEPDGMGSHWFKVDAGLQKSARAQSGDTVALAIESTKLWPEPVVPADVRAALNASPEAHALWAGITPMARWEWLRWIGSTRHPETRRRRIETACSKLRSGERRPCCFNRNMCCIPEVSRNGILLKPLVTTK